MEFPDIFLVRLMFQHKNVDIYGANQCAVSALTQMNTDFKKKYF